MKAAARLLELENKQLHDRVAKLIEKLAKFEGTEPNEQLLLELTKLKEQVAAQNKKLYGNSSERRRRKTRDDDDDEKPKPRTTYGYRDQPELSVEVVVRTLPSDEEVCTSCGGARQDKGQTVEKGEEITVVEREYKLVKYHSRVFSCDCPGEDYRTGTGQADTRWTLLARLRNQRGH